MKADIFVESLKVRHFRGIENLSLDLQPGLTLLVGRNNAGKSRLLRALRVAVGGAPVERDDLTVGSNQNAEIEVVVAPQVSGVANASVADLQLEELFETAVTQRLGSAVSLTSIDPARQRFAWRTTIRPTKEGSGARSHSQVMTFSTRDEQWHVPEVASHLTSDRRGLVVAELIDTSRDLDRDFRRPGSALRRILNDLEVPEGDREELESQLAQLGSAITERSRTLQEIQNSLLLLERFLDMAGTARVEAIPQYLEELARTVGVSFDDGQQMLSSRLQGSGVRSLGTLLIQDLFYRGRLGSDGPDLRPHALALIEEPEANLHPHAIFELPTLLDNQQIQVVATTHSPQLASVVNHHALFLIRRSPDGEHLITPFGPEHTQKQHSLPRSKRPQFFIQEMEKLKRLAERPFGDLLFARAVVICEGATERGFLPPVISSALRPLGHGISVVDSYGMDPNLVKAVIKFALHVDIPFLILADQDSAGRCKVQQLVNDNMVQENTDVIWIQQPAIGIQGKDQGMSAIERMLMDFDLDLCQRVCVRFGLPATDRKTTLSSLKAAKGSIGPYLAEEFIDTYPYGPTVQWPTSLIELTRRLRKLLESRPPSM